MIASLSPSGMSAQLMTRPENIKRGSGLNTRVFASFFLANEDEIQPGFTTGISASDAALNSSKSIVVETMWVRPSRETGPSFESEQCCIAPFSLRVCVS